MSTFRHRDPRGRAFLPGNPGGRGAKMYRCIYCRRIFNDRDRLPGHEAMCDARVIVRRWIWQMALERARRREAADR